MLAVVVDVLNVNFSDRMIASIMGSIRLLNRGSSGLFSARISKSKFSALARRVAMKSHTRAVSIEPKFLEADYRIQIQNDLEVPNFTIVVNISFCKRL